MSWEVEIQLVLGSFFLDVQLSGGFKPVAIIGPNGSGKTTLLRAIAGAYHPTAGRIDVDGRCLFDAARGISLPPELRRVGYVPQGYGLFPHLNVLDNVAFGLLAQRPRPPKHVRHQAAREQLARLGCEALTTRDVKVLSGGEQQRVALARALLCDPVLLLLDEPLAALDAAARRGLRNYLRERLFEQAVPALIVTHDVRDVFGLCEKVYVLTDGRVLQHGTPEEVAHAPKSDFVAEFFLTDLSGLQLPLQTHTGEQQQQPSDDQEETTHRRDDADLPTQQSQRINRP